MTDAEKLLELSEEFGKKRAGCSVWCPLWNTDDNDCELYGENHLTPATCLHFLMQELERGKNGGE